MEVFARTFSTMNTRLSLLVPGLAQERGEVVARAVGRALRVQERVMSRFSPDAELYRVNATAAAGPVPVSAALWAVLGVCADHWRRTEGAFDITCGSAGAPGAPAGFAGVRLDPTKRSVAFAWPKLQLDLGAIGKGVALRRMEHLLRRRRIDQAFVSFGESSILALGSHPAGGDWLVGFEAPPMRDGTLPLLSLRDGSMSTSGQAAGRAPIIDPATSRPAPRDRLLAVACACPVEAEVLSTALLARPQSRATILARYGPVRATEIAVALDRGAPISKVMWTHG